MMSMEILLGTYANLYKVHKGKEINLLFCNTVEAYNGSDFKLASKNLKPVLANSKWEFLTLNPRSFYTAFKSTTCMWYWNMNNMAYTFNGYIFHHNS